MDGVPHDCAEDGIFGHSACCRGSVFTYFERRAALVMWPRRPYIKVNQTRGVLRDVKLENEKVMP